MTDRIILLTGDIEAPHLKGVLAEFAPDLAVSHANSTETLEAVCRETQGKLGQDRRRLIAYCTSVIAPKSVLKAVDGPSYNFHPGPPTHPGVHSASFAVFEQVERFGATAHIMEDKPDSGAIVGVSWFDIAANTNCSHVESVAYLGLFKLFKTLAPKLVDLDHPLAPEDIKWGEHLYTNAEYDKLGDIRDDMSGDEIARRHRAIE